MEKRIDKQETRAEFDPRYGEIIRLFETDEPAAEKENDQEYNEGIGVISDMFEELVSSKKGNKIKVFSSDPADEKPCDIEISYDKLLGILDKMAIKDLDYVRLKRKKTELGTQFSSNLELGGNFGEITFFYISQKKEGSDEKVSKIFIESTR